ncbi:MAG: GC-type dockerin domain-anchored protein [Planctomycetota bacterium]
MIVHAAMIAVSAGLAAAVFDRSGTIGLAPRGTAPGDHIAHIYYNVGTGERIATLLDGARPSDNGVSPAVWIADNTVPCTSFGQTGGRLGVMDDMYCTTCLASTQYGATFLDWGDIPSDTVVDCVGVTWSANHQDFDLDGDGVGDGVPGLGATWAWFDAENGFDSSSTRRPIVSLTLFDLPAFTSDFVREVVTYTATIDLAASFSSSLVFEIGDTNALDDSGTGFFNPLGGVDIDNDGFTDFGYSMRYHQPGTADFDGDGEPDGDPRATGTTGWALVTGNGDVTLDGTYIPETGIPGAIGIEDAFDVLYDPDSDGLLEPLGTFFYGGFECVGPTGNTPFAQFYMKLYSAPHCVVGRCSQCPVDLFPPGANDGVVNFFDLSEYIGLFNAGDPGADFFPPASPDGQLNFFDVSQYLADFAAGCP